MDMDGSKKMTLREYIRKLQSIPEKDHDAIVYLNYPNAFCDFSALNFIKETEVSHICVNPNSDNYKDYDPFSDNNPCWEKVVYVGTVVPEDLE